MIKLCKMAGAHSIAISSSISKLERCKNLGSYVGINYKKFPVHSERCKMITDREGDEAK
jgi:NADPH:quinone reductase-like Zn-dependent oxidoreductase